MDAAPTVDGRGLTVGSVRPKTGRMKALAPVLILGLAACTSNGDKTAKTQATSQPQKEAPAKEAPAKEASGEKPSAPPASNAYAELLDTYVKDGLVDYKGLGANDMAKLDGVIAAIGAKTLPEARDAKIGFYIDAYNAIVLYAVLKNDRPRSVLDVKGFFKEAKYKVAGQDVTLDQLEKEVLNPFAKDPRTHFVLVCGAIGCPILESTPYEGSDVNARMDAATRRYVTSPAGAVVEDGALKLSQIFNWYKADFGGDAGVVAFVKKHLPEAQATKAGDAPKVSYIDYNWTLNQQ